MRAVAIATSAFLVFLCGACGGAGVRPAEPGLDRGVTLSRGLNPEAQWQDALGPRPKLLVSFRPQALRQDKVYGPLLRFALAVARRRSRVAAATRVLEAVGDAEQFIASVETEDGSSTGTTQDGGEGAGGDILAIVRGVRSDLDPEALVDSDGQALWSPGPSGHVRELVHERDTDGTPNPASLFELPGRTWVIASGAARGRARDAFAHPNGRRPPPLDQDALAVLRIDGPSLVAHIPALQGRGGLAPVGRGLQAVFLELAPGVDRAVRAEVSYADEPTARLAEAALHEVQDAVARKNAPGLSWLVTATVGHGAPPDATVRITAPIPPEVLGEWLGPTPSISGSASGSAL